LVSSHDEVFSSSQKQSPGFDVPLFVGNSRCSPLNWATKSWKGSDDRMFGVGHRAVIAVDHSRS
jgi:hypothetical protein